MTWALVYGAVFALLALAVSPWLVSWFAHGYAPTERARVVATLSPLFLQVAVAPAMLVLGQRLLLAGRARTAILLGSLNAASQCMVLIGASALGSTEPSTLAFAVGGVCALVSLFALAQWGPTGVMRVVPDLRALWPFIRASAAMRGTHSIHNFLVVLLTNNALSGGVEGTVAVFQYARKITDGLISVAVGPHQAVYHAALARAWVRGDLVSLRGHVRDYLSSALPVLAVAAFVGAGAVGALWKFSPAAVHALGSDGLLVVAVLLVWQALIAVESVPVGVLIVERSAGALLAVNTAFALSLFMALKIFVTPPHGGLAVAAVVLACQVLSAMAFALLAARLVKQRFGE